MKIIFFILLLSINVFGKEFKMNDGSIISILYTEYGIMVDNKYKLKYTHKEHIANREYASVYQNKGYKYSISCEGSFCDILIRNKKTNENVNYGTDDLTPDPVCWIHIYKNGKYFDLHSGRYHFEDCESSAKKFNDEWNDKGFEYIVTNKREI